MTTCHAPSCALLHSGKSHLNSYINPAKPRRCTKKIKTKTEKVKIKPEKTKIKPKKIKMQTTSCNMTAPWISCCTSLGVFGEDTSTSANQQYQNDCTPSSACKSSSWWDFFFLQQFDSEVWPDSQLSNSFNKSSPNPAQKQKANLCLPGTS